MRSSPAAEAVHAPHAADHAGRPVSKRDRLDVVGDAGPVQRRRAHHLDAQAGVVHLGVVSTRRRRVDASRSQTGKLVP